MNTGLSGDADILSNILLLLLFERILGAPMIKFNKFIQSQIHSL